MGFPYRIIYVAIHSGNTPHLIGPTGCGKTEGMFGVARDWLNVNPAHMLVLHGAQQDPITLGSGVPFRNDDGQTFSAVTEKRLYEVATNPEGFIFLDELADADIDQMRSLSPFINEREVAGVRIEAAMTGASNRPKDGANELDKRLASRLMHIAVRRDRQELIKAMRDPNGWTGVMGRAPKVPADWVNLIPEKEKQVADFIDQHGEALPDEDGNIDMEFPAHPNARTWQKFGVRWLACAEASKLSRKEIQTGLEGCVGRGLGAQFMMWSRHGGMDVKAIIADTTQLKQFVGAAPDTIDTLFDAVGAYVAEGVITGDQCGGFYAAALKYGFDPETVLRHLRRISEKLPKAVRESIANEIAVRQNT